MNEEPVSEEPVLFQKPALPVEDITSMLIAEYVPRKIKAKNTENNTEELIDLDSLPNMWEILCLMLPMLAVIIGIGVGLQIAKTEDEIMYEKNKLLKVEDDEEESAETTEDNEAK